LPSLVEKLFPSVRRAAAVTLAAAGLVAASVTSAAAADGPGHDYWPSFDRSGRGSSPSDGPGRTLNVPSKLKPPAGNVAAGTFSARGVQVYECTGGSWKFVEPVATLTGPGGRVEAIHYRGPSWQSTTDGSLVVAKAVADHPVSGTIPWLLLEATDNRGDGLFGRVTYIQRLSTSGGAAPSGGCKDGETEGVPYRAQYRVFVKKAR
jgi:hypothetical protein